MARQYIREGKELCMNKQLTRLNKSVNYVTDSARDMIRGPCTMTKYVEAEINRLASSLRPLTLNEIASAVSLSHHEDVLEICAFRKL